MPHMRNTALPDVHPVAEASSHSQALIASSRYLKLSKPLTILPADCTSFPLICSSNCLPHATTKELKMPCPSLLAPLNHRLSPMVTCRTDKVKWLHGVLILACSRTHPISTSHRSTVMYKVQDEHENRACIILQGNCERPQEAGTYILCEYLADVEVAIPDSSCDQVVATTLVAISCTVTQHVQSCLQL
jgi:hypothetical protein